MFRPLPEFLTIDESSIDGLGLFATEEIREGMPLGLSHIRTNGEWIRTPIGGFYNHSDNPNAIKEKIKRGHKDAYQLVTLRNIHPGEEITVKYTLYDVKAGKSEQ